MISILVYSTWRPRGRRRAGPRLARRRPSSRRPPGKTSAPEAKSTSRARQTMRISSRPPCQLRAGRWWRPGGRERVCLCPLQFAHTPQAAAAGYRPEILLLRMMGSQVSYSRRDEGRELLGRAGNHGAGQRRGTPAPSPTSFMVMMRVKTSLIRCTSPASSRLAP